MAFDLDCSLHGLSTSAYSDVAKGNICIQCVKDNLWDDRVTKEIVAHYPKYFRPRLRLLQGGRQTLNIYRKPPRLLIVPGGDQSR